MVKITKINLKPLGDHILVKPEKKKEHSQGGLIIPAVVNQDMEEGIVVAVSPAVQHISIGDKVLYQSRIGTSILIEQENYKFITGPTETTTGNVIAITEPAKNSNDTRMS